MLSAITLVRNGNLLNYPWKLCIAQLQQTCDEILVNCDAGEDDTLQDLQAIASKDPRVKVFPFVWNMSNTGDGRELAIQANNLLPHVSNPWVLYVQADELIHQKDSVPIRQYLASLPDNISQVELYRTYFWENITTRIQEEEIWLGRIFRTGTHKVGGDGMYLLRTNGGYPSRSPFWLYHYSRIGTEDQITNRVRTLDRLFHPEDEVKTYDKFSYYKEQKGRNLVPYIGTHPHGVTEFYVTNNSPWSGWVC